MEGSLEAWIEKQKMAVNIGDTLYLPAGTVHAHFNVCQNPASILYGKSVPIFIACRLMPRRNVYHND
jgi:quercetin dioxygenase-like cupin family protein